MCLLIPVYQLGLTLTKHGHPVSTGNDAAHLLSTETADWCMTVCYVNLTRKQLSALKTDETNAVVIKVLFL